MQLETLARGQWQQRCLDRVETRIWTDEMEKAQGAEYPMGEAWCNRATDFMRIQRRMDAAQRSYDKALHEWVRLRHAGKVARTPVKPAPAIHLADLPSSSRWKM